MSKYTIPVRICYSKVGSVAPLAYAVLVTQKSGKVQRGVKWKVPKRYND